ncbi:hypothetical protein M011DRAFT_497146 [Sporormia fimetaria CBS 119925]|uniref:DUF1275 domain protein n=1 Tax=Sporormia fimetaria CBS 119925 TaxID=1340428 RepID=A0A6A6UZZ6_9PLEO|nr:hypothetical protein M011DRAFT_497146 [Sporormia fimetaria CBS 119925]
MRSSPVFDEDEGKRTDASSPAVETWKHHQSNINKEWGDLVLLYCYLITGLLDSAATHIWGSFVSMQTGNTVYVGLGLAAPNADNRWIRALVSLAAFCVGSYFFSRFHRHLSPRRRWVLIASFIIQLLFLVLAAIIVTVGKNAASSDLHWQVLVPLAAVAFQSSGQAVMSRVLQYGGLTSVVLTSNYCDLFSDAHLFALKNVERNRRAAAPLLLLAGAVAGGVWARSSIGMKGALWTAVFMKSLIVVAWEVWWKEPEPRAEE